ncbi:hypothetical protein [Actinomadura madurae]|uniref:hypothetical protein n=1 Tax=Actinomadura madurae TaxID=1993 RepID=UPI000942E620|nr:hypothetical protein [Actinomadura madurae]
MGHDQRYGDPAVSERCEDGQRLALTNRARVEARRDAATGGGEGGGDQAVDFQDFGEIVSSFRPKAY